MAAFHFDFIVWSGQLVASTESIVIPIRLTKHWDKGLPEWVKGTMSLQRDSGKEGNKVLSSAEMFPVEVSILVICERIEVR